VVISACASSGAASDSKVNPENKGTESDELLPRLLSGENQIARLIPKTRELKDVPPRGEDIAVLP